MALSALEFCQKLQTSLLCARIAYYALFFISPILNCLKLVLLNLLIISLPLK